MNSCLKKIRGLVAGIVGGVCLMVAPNGAAEVQMDVQIANPVMSPDISDRTFLKVGLTGRESTGRPLVNVAIVLDKSESMVGEGIIRAKEAAKYAVSKLTEQDVACLITYDTSVRVLVPATRVTDKELFHSKIDAIEPGGKTALFAGISKGAAEVRKFLDRGRVNRVILITDGRANIGPNSPGDLGDLGTSLLKEGISVTTIGLGLEFHEDLIERLANKSDGNHLFVEEASALKSVFTEEFDDVFSVVAQDVDVEIVCADGITPVSVLGREADIVGKTVTTSLNQIYSGQEKYILLEVEVEPGAIGKSKDVAEVRAEFSDLTSGESDKRLRDNIEVTFTDDPSEVNDNVDKAVMVAFVTQKATLTNRKALELRDGGQVQQAKDLLVGNWNYLRENAIELQSQQLNSYAVANGYDSRNLENDESWNKTRKGMRAYQFSNERQQRYIPLYGQLDGQTEEDVMVQQALEDLNRSQEAVNANQGENQAEGKENQKDEDKKEREREKDKDKPEDSLNPPNPTQQQAPKNPAYQQKAAY